jgi:hypothetical protein
MQADGGRGGTVQISLFSLLMTMTFFMTQSIVHKYTTHLGSFPCNTTIEAINRMQLSCKHNKCLASALTQVDEPALQAHQLGYLAGSCQLACQSCVQQLPGKAAGCAGKRVADSVA